MNKYVKSKFYHVVFKGGTCGKTPLSDLKVFTQAFCIC